MGTKGFSGRRTSSSILMASTLAAWVFLARYSAFDGIPALGAMAEEVPSKDDPGDVGGTAYSPSSSSCPITMFTSG